MARPRGGAAGRNLRCGKPALGAVIFLAALAIFVMHEKASAPGGAAYSSASAGSGGSWVVSLSHWTGSSSGDGGTIDSGSRAVAEAAAGGRFSAKLLRELHTAALQTPDAKAFADWAVGIGLLSRSELPAFLDRDSSSLARNAVAAAGGGSGEEWEVPNDGKLHPVKLQPLKPGLEPLACPLPAVEAARKVARGNTIVFALMNEELLDFGINWYRHLQQLKVDNVWVAAYDEPTARFLASENIPCLDARQMFSVDPALGFKWGEENWRSLVWGRITVANWIMQAGFNLVLSDIDVVWFKDPNAILASYSQADLLLTTDALQTFLPPGDEGLEDAEKIFLMGTSFNTGAMLWRNTYATRRLMSAWEYLRHNPVSPDGKKRYFNDQEALNARYLRPGVSHEDKRWFNRNGDRIIWTFDRTVPMGVFPISRFATGHGYSVQRLHKVKKLEPYVLHTTYVYGSQPGKRTRLREAGHWLADPPGYFQGRFLTLDMQLPEVPQAHMLYQEKGHMPWELEKQIRFHAAAVQFQLEQLYFGFALAVALNRTLILPEMRCFCDKNWYMTDQQCHTPGAEELRYPFPCPADYLFWPGRFADEPQRWGPPIDFRVHSFLDDPRLPSAVKASAKVVRTNAGIGCSDCAKDSGGEVTIPERLTDTQLRQALRQFDNVSMLRFADAPRAFSDFQLPGDASSFQTRLDHLAGTWCCRSPEAMEKNQLEAEIFYAIRPANGTTERELRLLSSNAPLLKDSIEAAADAWRRRAM